MAHARTLNEQSADLYSDFKDFIVAKDHPCVMAQTVFSMDAVTLKEYPSFGTRSTAAHILSDLKEYLDTCDFEANTFQTFIATFPDVDVFSEIEFEKLLWQQLQFIHEADTQNWDSAVSKDPDDPSFSFSIGGTAFYIVGMHPKSSRKARRAPVVTLVFNLHWQFDKLREMGTYQRVRDTIRRRDKTLQGSVNPVLKDFGEESEARQYSGRHVEAAWKCPFHASH
ncbi:guanitoxin biosynthesis heme-dependent pre-guanitoxin N-hydroxylase GntA [Altibacter lentus]|uniref:guanitoxin biosynthesis heme-dependent pre-guanitoxin N-hydroxylase GntA n=1 Tax=Altibacter lentus TaxID=1223410 RepID=UPI00054E8659|nr:guanitoxin biosynthesis heme-dependent pre-guanitoxin N-hydroxylase GntA [Altibacter lentus]